jgi:hypothetical protein
MEAAQYEPGTGALTLRRPGSLAFPFFVESVEADKFGRWFFVAGAEALKDGRVRVLAPDDRHAPLDAEPLAQTRRLRPQGLRGILVNLGGEPRFIETAPLISDTRGMGDGGMSNLVADIDVSSISERKRGGLQMLTVLALSPATGAWAPVLNFRDGATGNHAAHGRGLFAEGDGRSLGRLAASRNGGPVLADAEHCAKHLYGAAADDDGLYRESAGHISTEAFFKAPGDAVHDAPLTFYREPFAGRVPPWPPFEAQIKYHEQGGHEWDGRQRPGRWRIQYRVPFLPEIPQSWRPPILPPELPPPVTPPGDPPPDDPPRVPVPILPPEGIVPVISENEIWAPSHDWLPAPSDRENDTPVPFPGPSIKSEGWAGESEGYPDPAEGGGCIFLPPDRIAPDQNDSGERKTWLVLHPEVSLGFGHAGVQQGSLINGWSVQLAQEGQLVLTPVDEEGDAIDDNSRALEVAAPVGAAALDLEPQSANPGGATTLWAHTDGSPRWGADQLALAANLAGMLRTAIVTYTGSGETGRTVALSGINRAHAIVLMGRTDGRAISLTLPSGSTGSVTFKDASGSNESSFSLDAPSPGTSQTLTINNTLDDFNATDEEYDMLVFGT